MKKQKPRLQQKKVAKPPKKTTIVKHELSAAKKTAAVVEPVQPTPVKVEPKIYGAKAATEPGYVEIGNDIIYDAMTKEIEDLKMQLGIANAEIQRLKREVDAYDRLATLLKEERAKQADTTLGIRQPAKTDDLPSLNDMKPLPALD